MTKPAAINRVSLEATIFRVAGVQRCVRVPADVAARLGGGVRPRVSVRVADASFETTLIPAGGGAFRMVVPLTVLKALGWGEDAIFPIELQLVTEAAPPELPADLSAALAAQPQARVIYDSQTDATKRQIAKDLTAAKSATARANRVARMVKFITRMKLRYPAESYGGFRRSE